MDYKVTKELKFADQVFDARYHPNHDDNLIGVVTIAGDIHL